jgi:ribosomal protein S4
MSIPVVSELIKEEPALPAWLQKKSAVVKVARKPERVDITEVLEEQLVVEYYSR